MNRDEFDKTRFGVKMKCHYLNGRHEFIIKGVDFYQGTIWISKGKNDEGFWAQYKNVELVTRS